MQEHAYAAPAGTIVSRDAARRDGRPAPLAPLALAGACLLALALLWALSNLVPALWWRDAVLLRDFTTLNGPRVDKVASFLLHLLSPLPFVLWGVALMAIAIARERVRTAVAVAVVMALAPYTTEQLKPLVAHQHAHVGGVFVGAASWPSGHSTAAAALVLCALLVSPPRLRAPVGALGALYLAAVCCSLLILAWHMPSDVLGGLLVSSCWTALAVAVLRVLERRWPSSQPPAGGSDSPAAWAPGSHSGSPRAGDAASPEPACASLSRDAPSSSSDDQAETDAALAARLRMNSRSESLLR